MKRAHTVAFLFLAACTPRTAEPPPAAEAACCTAEAATAEAHNETTGPRPSAELTRATVGDVKVSIEEQEGRCVLRIEGEGAASTLPLAPKPPCAFVHDKKGRLQTFRYEDVGVDATLIVLGTPADEPTRTDANIPGDVYCGTVSHGVLVSDGRVQLSQKPLEGLLACATYGLDEKVFWQLAHPDP